MRTCIRVAQLLIVALGLLLFSSKLLVVEVETIHKKRGCCHQVRRFAGCKGLGASSSAPSQFVADSAHSLAVIIRGEEASRRDTLRRAGDTRRHAHHSLGTRGIGEAMLMGGGGGRLPVFAQSTPLNFRSTAGS